MSILSCFSKAIVTTAALVILSACGQRGALIHPNKDKAMRGERAKQTKSEPPAVSADTANQSSAPPPVLPSDQPGDKSPAKAGSSS